MVHAAVGYARMQQPARRRSPARARSGPGATNMVTGAALATDQPAAGAAAARRRLRAATRRTRCCSSSRCRAAGDVSVNDCFRPVSRYFDRISRPEQVIPARARGDARADEPGRDRRRRRSRFPQDVQAEAFDFPEEFFERARLARAARPRPTRRRSRARSTLIRGAQRPLDRRRRRRHLLARRPRRCARSARRPASRSARRRPARARCRTTTRRASARSARPARSPRTASPREADLVIGIGTRYSDFTTASKTAFQDPGVRFVNVNVAELRRREARRRPRSSATRAPRSSELAERARGLRRSTTTTAPRRRALNARVGRRGRRASTRSATARCRRRAR